MPAVSAKEMTKTKEKTKPEKVDQETYMVKRKNVLIVNTKQADQVV